VSDRHEPLSYMHLASLSDENLMANLRARHSDALAVLYDRYHALIFGVASRILRDHGEAEDLMQSVFLEIFRAAAQYDESKGSPKVWILQYAYHRSFDRRRYLALRGFYEYPEEVTSPHALPTKPSGKSLDRLESIRVLQQTLCRLSKQQRKTLELAFYEGLTMREIGQKMGWSLDSAKHHYYRGLEKLRSIFCEKPDPSLKAPSGDCVTHVRS
jgi:RNA polymerase sigma-70 factor (ECF subfamily)